MSTDTKTTNVTPASGNVFADLGFEPQLAVELKSQSERIIADKLAIKEHLLTELAAWIQVKEFTRSDAAALFGVTGQRVSDVLSMRATHFTLDALVDMVLRTGRSVRLSIQ
jgi:predicted XRE-type DNA-binding protein